jgi:hypothetical protein
MFRINRSGFNAARRAQLYSLVSLSDHENIVPVIIVYIRAAMLRCMPKIDIVDCDAVVFVFWIAQQKIGR